MKVLMMSILTIPEPVITWEEPEVTIPEGGSEQVCFTSDIGTAQPYQVRVGVRGKGDRPAAQGRGLTILSLFKQMSVSLYTLFR